MKFEQADIDAIADAVVAKLKSAAVVTATKTPEKAADKPVEKKVEKTAEKGPSHDDVQAALRDYKTKYSLDAALAILHVYAPKVADLKPDQLPKVLADLKKEPSAKAAAAEDEPF